MRNKKSLRHQTSHRTSVLAAAMVLCVLALCWRYHHNSDRIPITHEELRVDNHYVDPATDRSEVEMHVDNLHQFPAVPSQLDTLSSTEELRIITPRERLVTLTQSPAHARFLTLSAQDMRMPGVVNDVIALIRSLLDRSDLDVGPQISLGNLPTNTPQSDTVLKVLKNKKEGVFIECGAYDGETASNTIDLEIFNNWTGILIEPNPYYYTQVMGKNRRAVSLNACLGSQPHPSLLSMSLHCDLMKGGHCGQIGKVENRNDINISSDTPGSRITVPCFPLALILRAANIQTVDFFSLDVEGAEYDILKTIPFHELDIRTLSVEYKHDSVGREVIVDFMKTQGYSVYKNLKHGDMKKQLWVEDIFFVKDDIEIDRR